MKKTNKFLFILVGVMAWVFVGEAVAQTISFRTENFRRVNTEKGQAVAFDIVAKNVTNERIVTRIYDITCHIEGNVTSPTSGRVGRASCDMKWDVPSKFKNLNLGPQESVKNGVSVPYTSFKHSEWRWEGEQNDPNFYITDIVVSNIKCKADGKEKQQSKTQQKTSAKEQQPPTLNQVLSGTVWTGKYTDGITATITMSFNDRKTATMVMQFPGEKPQSASGSYTTYASNKVIFEPKTRAKMSFIFMGSRDKLSGAQLIHDDDPSFTLKLSK